MQQPVSVAFRGGMLLLINSGALRGCQYEMSRLRAGWLLRAGSVCAPSLKDTPLTPAKGSVSPDYLSALPRGPGPGPQSPPCLPSLWAASSEKEALERERMSITVVQTQVVISASLLWFHQGQVFITFNKVCQVPKRSWVRMTKGRTDYRLLWRQPMPLGSPAQS